MAYSGIGSLYNKRLPTINSRRMRFDRIRLCVNPTAQCVVQYVVLYYVRTLTKHSKHVAAALGAGGFKKAWQNHGKPNALVH